MTAYCTTEDLESYVLSAYMTSAEALHPGIRARHIAQVSTEIDEALAALYQVPLDPIPATVNRVCAVLAVSRVVGEITTLVTEDGSTKNEWIPLQTLAKQCQADLQAMRAGKSGYGLDGSERTEQSVIVLAGKPLFGDRFWREKY